MHFKLDPPPRVLEAEIGLRLAASDDGRHRRPDMDVHATIRFRPGRSEKQHPPQVPHEEMPAKSSRLA
jgi:hypothetical protein